VCEVRAVENEDIEKLLEPLKRIDSVSYPERINMNRAFLSVVALACGVLGWSEPARSAEPADKRPNILFAMADDWAWPHAGVYGDKVVKTPTFDRVAREGMLFSHAFSVTPSCTASRAAVLTGQYPHRLEESGNLWSILRKRYDTYPDLLEAAGYHVGLTRKGWGPGSLEGSGRTRNPAGPNYKDFETFLRGVPEGKPFCFWFGSHDPHRAYVKGSGVKSGMDPDKVFVPPYLPDTAEVRSDICDYYLAAQRYDRETGDMLKLLEQAGKLDNTIVVMTGDNGWPFPRGKANLYDAGTRQPLAIRWPARVKGGRKSDAFISFQDFAPTFLAAAGLKVPETMTGRSFLDLLTGESDIKRDRVFVERERHANVRKGDLGYPSRALRTRDFLYIRNFHPERWPAGDPELWKAVGPYGDIDGGPTKEVLLAGKDDPKIAKLFQLACGKRPAEELYDLAKDPYQMNNLAEAAEYQETRKSLRKELDQWMRATADPRATGDDDRWDKYPYFGSGPKK
jgi:arylsulfatase A-like enzyme